MGQSKIKKPKARPDSRLNDAVGQESPRQHPAPVARMPFAEGKGLIREAFHPFGFVTGTFTEVSGVASRCPPPAGD